VVGSTCGSRSWNALGGTYPGPEDGRFWPRVGRGRAKLNLLLMNLFQKVRDFQLKAGCPRARARAAGV
jgi:hypothetical protein